MDVVVILFTENIRYFPELHLIAFEALSWTVIEKRESNKSNSENSLSSLSLSSIIVCLEHQFR